MTELDTSPDWITDAACYRAPRGVMFPQDANHRMISVRAHPEAYAPALALCAECDHHAECRELWIAEKQPFEGVWFGTTPIDRQRDPHPRRPTSTQIIDWVRANGPATVPQIAAGIQTSTNAVYVTIRNLVDDGRIERRDGRPSTFSIPVIQVPRGQELADPVVPQNKEAAR